MKKHLILATCFFGLLFTANVQATNCPQALPATDPNFCSSFKSSAECHCVSHGLPEGICSNMNSLYDMLIIRFGTLNRVCEYQQDTTTQTCMDDWNCYRLGGTDSQGNACSSTGKACQ